MEVQQMLENKAFASYPVATPPSTRATGQLPRSGGRGVRALPGPEGPWV